jgi:death-on-curing family protein
VLTHDEAVELIAALKKNLLRQRQASETFGKEKNDGLKRILENIAQMTEKKSSMSVEEKAAHLLYAFTKDHPFQDGNKRIAAFLFIVYLTRTECLTAHGGERKFSDSALVALVLLVAESQPEHKELLLKLITNFVHGK